VVATPNPSPRIGRSGALKRHKEPEEKERKQEKENNKKNRRELHVPMQGCP
jgi:hypothetical protein